MKKYYKNAVFMKDFGIRLKFLRESKKLTQEQLANITEFEISQISRIERGVQNTSISHVEAIAKALGVHPSELFNF